MSYRAVMFQSGGAWVWILSHTDAGQIGSGTAVAKPAALAAATAAMNQHRTKGPPAQPGFDWQEWDDDGNPI